MAADPQPDSLAKITHDLAEVAGILTIDSHILEGAFKPGELMIRVEPWRQFVQDIKAAADRLPALVERLRAL